MATVTGTSGQSLDDTAELVRRFALKNGYALTEAKSAPGVSLLIQGFNLLSRQLTLTITLRSSQPSETELTIVTGMGSTQLTDWGRGKRAAIDLLLAIGATRGVAA